MLLLVFFCFPFLNQVSEDEVVVSGCDLQDVSVMPLLNALQAHKTIAVLDISHNLLGNCFWLVGSLFDSSVLFLNKYTA